MGGDRKEVDIESDPDEPKETSDKEKSNEGKEKHKEQIVETTKFQCEVHKTKKERYEKYCKWKSMAMIMHVGIVTKTLHINVVAKYTRIQCIR